MDESGPVGLRSQDELRAALRRLEDALARHERQLPPASQDHPADLALHALRRGVLLMRQEAQRLRLLLAQG